MISRDFIQRIQNEVSIVNLIGKYVPLKKAGKEYIGCCPFHEEKTPSFSVNDQKGICKCFGCGEGGNVIDFVMKHQSLSFVDAVDLIAAENGMTVEYDKKSQRSNKPDNAEAHGKLLGFLNKIYIGARDRGNELDRLSMAGIPKENALKLQIGYPFYSPQVGEILQDSAAMAKVAKDLGIRNGILPSDSGSSGLSFPLFDHTNALKGLYLHCSSPKIIGHKSTRFDNLLYFPAKIDTAIEQVILTTDPLQATRLSSAGLKGVMCVASPSKIFSPKACNFLSGLRTRLPPLIIMENNLENIGKFKNDVIDMIRHFDRMPGFKILLMPKNMDLASLYKRSGQAIFSKVTDQSVSWDKLFTKLISDEVLQHDATQHTRIVQELTANMYTQSPKDLYSSFLISSINSMLAQRLSLDVDETWQKVCETIEADMKQTEQQAQLANFKSLVDEIGIKVKGIELEALNRLAALVSFHHMKIDGNVQYQSQLKEIVDILDHPDDTNTLLSKLVYAGEEFGYLSSSLLKAELTQSEQQTLNQKIIDLHEAGLLDQPDEIEVSLIKLRNTLTPTALTRPVSEPVMQMGI